MSRLLFWSFETPAAAVPQPTTSAYASMLAALLPPGRVWRLTDGVLQMFFAACAAELDRLDARTFDLIDESDPTAAVELLPEYESELDLASDGTNAERQARVKGRLVARQRFRPVDFQNALAPLLGQIPSAVVVIEIPHSAAITAGNLTGDEIFRFFIYRNPALPGTYYLSSAQALISKIKPSHTKGYAIESIAMIVDDPHSIVDRDLVGA